GRRWTGTEDEKNREKDVEHVSADEKGDRRLGAHGRSLELGSVEEKEDREAAADADAQVARGERRDVAFGSDEIANERAREREADEREEGAERIDDERRLPSDPANARLVAGA